VSRDSGKNARHFAFYVKPKRCCKMGDMDSKDTPHFTQSTIELPTCPVTTMSPEDDDVRPAPHRIRELAAGRAHCAQGVSEFGVFAESLQFGCEESSNFEAWPIPVPRHQSLRLRTT